MSKLTENQITRASLIWLLVTQILVILPFLFHLPIWLLPLLILSASWRLRAIRGYWQPPGKLTKLLAVLIGIAGLYVSGLTVLSLEAAASLLMLGFALKNLELNRRRDGLLVIFIGYFLVATLFLFDQSILITLYAIFLISVLTGALVSLHQARSHDIRGNLKLASLMLLQCLPLMIACYLFFPRLPPLWSVPAPSGAQTGVSDEITPGDIANLAQSGDLAFKATFEGDIPDQSDLYWRGLLLNHFDGKTWRQYSPDEKGFRWHSYWPGASRGEPEYQTTQPGQRYSVIYEPTQQHWFFTLTPSRVIEGEGIEGYDHRIYSRVPVSAVTPLTLEYFPESQLDLSLSASVRRQTLSLPEGQNPQAQLLALRERQIAGSDLQYALNMLQWFKQENFRYTLTPPTLGDSDTIDRFLFDSRLGFCAHFASAYTNLMRMANIPARIVAGYQGGEWNEQGKFLAIHQFDAHAWVEIWLEGAGWIRVDPTAVIAPDRIELNLREAVRDERTFLRAAGLGALKFSVFNNFRLQLEALQYRWQNWVLNYGAEDQAAMLSRLLGKVTVARVATFIGLMMVVILLFWVLLLGLHRKHHRHSEVHRQMQKLVSRLQQKGLPVSMAMAPSHIIQQLSGENAPWADSVKQYLNKVNEHLYQSEVDFSCSKRQFAQLLRQIS
jgi:transglutaminase-like putative cysteine protease